MKTQFVFKYIYENDHDGDMYLDDFANNKEVVVTLNGEQSLKQIFEEFKGFLQTAGYVFGTNDYIDKFNDFESDALPHEEEYEKMSSDQTEYEFDEGNGVVFRGGESSNIDNVDEYSGIPQYDTTSGRDLVEDDWNGFVSMSPKNDDKLPKIKEAIIPFLENLSADPEKNVIKWNNRAEVIEKKIQEIKDIIGE